MKKTVAIMIAIVLVSFGLTGCVSFQSDDDSDGRTRLTWEEYKETQKNYRQTLKDDVSDRR